MKRILWLLLVVVLASGAAAQVPPSFKPDGRRLVPIRVGDTVYSPYMLIAGDRNGMPFGTYVSALGVQDSVALDSHYVAFYSWLSQGQVNDFLQHVIAGEHHFSYRGTDSVGNSIVVQELSAMVPGNLQIKQGISAGVYGLIINGRPTIVGSDTGTISADHWTGIYIDPFDVAAGMVGKIDVDNVWGIKVPSIDAPHDTLGRGKYSFWGKNNLYVGDTIQVVDAISLFGPAGGTDTVWIKPDSLNGPSVWRVDSNEVPIIVSNYSGPSTSLLRLYGDSAQVRFISTLGNVYIQYGDSVFSADSATFPDIVIEAGPNSANLKKYEIRSDTVTVRGNLKVDTGVVIRGVRWPVTAPGGDGWALKVATAPSPDSGYWGPDATTGTGLDSAMAVAVAQEQIDGVVPGLMDTITTITVPKAQRTDTLGTGTPTVAYRGDTLVVNNQGDTGIVAIYSDSGNPTVLMYRNDSLKGSLTYPAAGGFANNLIMTNHAATSSSYMALDMDGKLKTLILKPLQDIETAAIYSYDGNPSGSGQIDVQDTINFKYLADFEQHNIDSVKKIDADSVEVDSVIVIRSPVGGTSTIITKVFLDSLRAGTIAAVFDTAETYDTIAGSIAVHVAAADPHTGYRQESADIDPDELSGDAVDDNKVDSNLVPKVSHSAFADTSGSSADEKVQDKVGAMVTGNTETGITVTYQDADGTLDFEVTAGAADGISQSANGDTTYITTDAGTCAFFVDSTATPPVMTVDCGGDITIMDSAYIAGRLRVGDTIWLFNTAGNDSVSLSFDDFPLAGGGISFSDFDTSTVLDGILDTSGVALADSATGAARATVADSAAVAGAVDYGDVTNTPTLMVIDSTTAGNGLIEADNVLAVRPGYGIDTTADLVTVDTTNELYSQAFLDTALAARLTAETDATADDSVTMRNIFRWMHPDFFDTTTAIANDSIRVIRSLISDSTSGGAARAELADSTSGGAARAELADSTSGGAARSELADSALTVSDQVITDKKIDSTNSRIAVTSIKIDTIALGADTVTTLGGGGLTVTLGQLSVGIGGKYLSITNDTVHLDLNSIDSTVLTENSVLASEIAAGAVGTSEIANGTVATVDLANGAWIDSAEAATVAIGVRSIAGGSSSSAGHVVHDATSNRLKYGTGGADPQVITLARLDELDDTANAYAIARAADSAAAIRPDIRDTVNAMGITDSTAVGYGLDESGNTLTVDTTNEIATRAYADAAALGDFHNLNIYGDATVWGGISLVNQQHKMDIGNPRAVNGDTILKIPTYLYTTPYQEVKVTATAANGYTYTIELNNDATPVSWTSPGAGTTAAMVVDSLRQRIITDADINDTLWAFEKSSGGALTYFSIENRTRATAFTITDLSGNLDTLTINAFDSDTTGDYWHPDSSCAMHPSVLYIPNGWNGYRWLMAYTTIPTIGGAPDFDFEIPAFAVSNDGENWHPFIDSFSVSPTYDSTIGPVVTRWNYMDCGALADPDIMVDADGVLWMYYIVGYWDASILRQGAAYTTDGLTWNTISPGGDTLFVIDTTNEDGGGMRSIAGVLGPDRTYDLFLIENPHANAGTDSARYVRYHSDYPCSLFTRVSVTTLIDIDGMKPWHMDVIKRGTDEYVTVANFAQYGSQSDPTGPILAARSTDRGTTWIWDTSAILLPQGGQAWDGLSMYRPTGHWLDDGQQTALRMYYNGIDSGLYYTTGVTDVEWDAEYFDSATVVDTILALIDATTVLDSGNVGADKLSEDDVNWRWEWFNMTNVHASVKSATDSVYLSFPATGANGDTLFLLRDSAGNVNTTAYDTASISIMFPFACTVDSLEVMYMTGAEISNNWIKCGPSGLCDSVLMTNTTDLTSATWDTAAYAITDKSVTSGYVMSWKYETTMADNERLRIAWVRIRGRR